MAKSAWIKGFAIEQVLKNNGIEIQVDDGDTQFGDIYVAKTGIVWCDGKQSRENGAKFSFEELALLAMYKDEALGAAKAAKKAAK